MYVTCILPMAAMATEEAPSAPPEESKLLREEGFAIALTLCLTGSVIGLASAADKYASICYHGSHSHKSNSCNANHSCGHSRFEWAIGCGAVSTAICVFRLLMLKFVATGVDFRVRLTLESRMLMCCRWTSSLPHFLRDYGSLALPSTQAKKVLSATPRTDTLQRLPCFRGSCRLMLVL